MNVSTRLTLLLTICLFAYPTSSVVAKDFIAERAYFEDKTARLGFEEIQQQPFKNYVGLLNKGFGNSAIWLRLHLDTPLELLSSDSDRNSPLIVRIRPAYLDTIQLFDPAFPSNQPRITGDLQTETSVTPPSFNFTFAVPAAPLPRDIYLRLTSTSTRMIYPDVLTAPEAARLDRRQEFLSMLYLGFLILSMSWALIHWLTCRDRIVGLFIVKQSTAILHAMALLGFNRIFLADAIPAIWIGNATNIIVLLFTFVAAVYEMAFIREFKPPMWLWRIIMSLIFTIYPLLMILLALGETSLALHTNLLTASVLLVSSLVLVSATRETDLTPSSEYLPLLPRSVLISYYGLLCFVTLSAILPGLGWIAGSAWALNNFVARTCVRPGHDCVVANARP